MSATTDAVFGTALTEASDAVVRSPVPPPIAGAMGSRP